MAEEGPTRARPLIVELSSTDAPDNHSLAQEEVITPTAQRSLSELNLASQPSQTSALVQEAVTAQHAVPVPSAASFPDIDAVAEGTTAAANAKRHSAAAAAALRELSTKLTAIAPSDVDFGPDPASNMLVGGLPKSRTASEARHGANRRGLRPGVLIEEVTDEAQPAAAPVRVSAAKTVLLCGLYASDGALASAWVTADTDAAASGALGRLAGMQTTAQGRESGKVLQSKPLEAGDSNETASGTGDVSGAAIAALQRLIFRVLPEVLRQLRPVLGEPRKPGRSTQTHMPPMTFREGEPTDPAPRRAAGVTTALPQNTN